MKILCLSMFAPFLLAGCCGICGNGGANEKVITKTLEAVTVTVTAQADINVVTNFEAYIVPRTGASIWYPATNHAVTLHINQIEDGGEIVAHSTLGKLLYGYTNPPCIIQDRDFELNLTPLVPVDHGRQIQTVSIKTAPKRIKITVAVVTEEGKVVNDFMAYVAGVNGWTPASKNGVWIVCTNQILNDTVIEVASSTNRLFGTSTNLSGITQDTKFQVILKSPKPKPIK